MIARINGLLRNIPVWVVYLAGGLLVPWFLYLAATGGLGVEPIKALEKELGRLGLKFLVAGLVITPLRRLTGVNLIRFRRSIGVLAFYYISCHLLVWLLLDVQALDAIVKDIVKRPFVTVGMAGFVLLVPLAATSNNWSVRRLGPAVWRKIHRLVYFAVLLGAVHFLMLTKGWQIEPMAYLAVIVLLLILRLPARRHAVTA